MYVRADMRGEEVSKEDVRERAVRNHCSVLRVLSKHLHRLGIRTVY